MPIHFFTEINRFKLKETSRLKKWITTVIQQEGCMTGEINYIFCSDEYLHEINKKYLRHSTFTDIITFDYGIPPQVSGDIYISIPRVFENSLKFKAPFYPADEKGNSELMRVMVHGILHLCGYKDKTAAEKKRMRKKENEYLSLSVRQNQQSNHSNRA